MAFQQQQRDRLSLLDDELKQIGLPSYRKYEHKINNATIHCENGQVDGGVKGFVRDFLASGSPAIDEVVSFLAPIIRRQLLVDNECWIPEDKRCVDFVAGSAKSFDAMALKKLANK